MTKIQKNDFIILFLFSLSILFWDFGQHLSYLRFSIILLPFFYFIYFKNDLFEGIQKIKDNWQYIFLPFIIILFHYLFTSLYIGSQISYLSLLKIFFVLIFFISIFLSYKTLEKKFNFLIYINIIIFFLLLYIDVLANIIDQDLSNSFTFDQIFTLSRFGRFENCYHSYFSEISKFFQEESHLAMVMAPILSTYFFIHFENKKNRAMYFVSLFLLLFIFFLALSLTFIMSSICFAILAILFSKKKSTKFFFVFLIIVFSVSFFLYPRCGFKALNITSNFLANLNNDYINEKIINIQNYLSKKTDVINKEELQSTTEIHTGLSSGVYLNSLSIANKSLFDYPFGTGFDNYKFSFYKYTHETSSEITNEKSIKKDLLILNHNDGSNNFAKLIVEFGGLNLIFLIIFVKFFFNNNIFLPLRLFVINLIITQTFLRGAGYFNGAFLIFVFLTIFLYNKNEN